MNFVEWTEQLILDIAERNDDEDYTPSVLIVGPGYNPNSDAMILERNNERIDIITPEPGKPIDSWIDEFRGSENFRMVDAIILSRVLEHIPVREIDWHIYQLYSILKDEYSDMFIIVPDMPAVCKAMIEEDEKDNPNEFLLERLTYELLSEGPHVFDRHAFWSSRKSVKRLLEKEALFTVDESEIKEIKIDSTIVPPELLIRAQRS